MPTESVIPTGKLPADLLAALLSKYTRPQPDVLIGPGVGLDATALAADEPVLVAASDPITFATDHIGWYAVHVNANDVVCLGARPRWFLATVLLPEGGTDAALVERLFHQITSACEGLGVALVGGHTEVTVGLDRPIVVGQMLGTTTRDRLLHVQTAQVGDRVVLVNPFPIEATAIIAQVRGEALAARGYSAETVAEAAHALFEPGISVVRAAQVAQAATQLRAMHDPTEGGVATGLREVAQAAGLGLEIIEAALPRYRLGSQLCAEFGLDSLGAIASGTLIVVVPPEGEATLLQALSGAGLTAATVGTLTANPESFVIVGEDGARPLPIFETDEITKLFSA